MKGSLLLYVVEQISMDLAVFCVFVIILIAWFDVNHITHVVFWNIWSPIYSSYFWVQLL